MRTSNPLLVQSRLEQAEGGAAQGLMTVQGAMNKMAILLLCVVVSASWVWTRLSDPAAATSSLGAWAIGASIVGFIVAIVLAFKQHLAPILAPVYSLCQGVFIGFVSASFESRYPGIVFQAVALTFGVAGTMILLYKTRVISMNDKWRMGIMMATGAVALFYLVGMVLSLFGIHMPLVASSSPMGIAFSGVVVVIAALNLILDFELVEHAAERGAPRYMEWYSAFALMVTLVWLYLEILRLLSKLRDRR